MALNDKLHRCFIINFFIEMKKAEWMAKMGKKSKESAPATIETATDDDIKF